MNKLIIITSVSVSVALLYAIFTPNQYEASITLAPAQEDNGALSGALGQLGGLASFAGMNINTGSTNESQIAQEIMQSWSFIDEFIEKHSLQIDLYAANGWDSSSNQLKIDSSLYNQAKKEWIMKGEDGEPSPPTSWKLFQSFKNRLTVKEDVNTGLVTVSMEHYSPFIAKNWLDMFIKSINEHMQKRQARKVTSNIKFLEDQIEKTSISGMKEVFFAIIEEQIKNKMLAEASPEYAFIAVNPSMVPERKSQPQRALICILGFVLGIIFSIIYIILFNFLKKD
jgi:uncharacterized protein involved in exopolysaccharide biosynthesis